MNLTQPLNHLIVHSLTDSAYNLVDSLAQPLTHSVARSFSHTPYSLILENVKSKAK
jgi:hypothetical protein